MKERESRCKIRKIKMRVFVGEYKNNKKRENKRERRIEDHEIFIFDAKLSLNLFR